MKESTGEQVDQGIRAAAWNDTDLFGHRIGPGSIQQDRNCPGSEASDAAGSADAGDGKK